MVFYILTVMVLGRTRGKLNVLKRMAASTSI